MATADQLRQERDLTAIRNQLAMAESRLLEAKKSQAPLLPKVIEAGAPAVWKEGRWHVYFPITTSLKEIWYRQRVLHIPPSDQHPFSVGLGLVVGQGQVVEGKYDLPGVRIFYPQLYCLPHIDTYGGCLGVVGTPPKLLTLEDYWALHSVLTRHCEGVQLDSLYTAEESWPPEMRKSIPPEVMEWLEDDGIGRRGLRRAMLGIFPDNEKEMFELAEGDNGEEEEEERPRCTCPDCRRARGEFVEAAAEPIEVPPAVASGDIWEVEAPV